MASSVLLPKGQARPQTAPTSYTCPWGSFLPFPGRAGSFHLMLPERPASQGKTVPPSSSHGGGQEGFVKEATLRRCLPEAARSRGAGQRRTEQEPRECWVGGLGWDLSGGLWSSTLAEGTRGLCGALSGQCLVGAA